MELLRIKTDKDERFRAAMELYEESFPLHERRTAESQSAALAEEDYHFNLIFDDDIFLGLLLCWETRGFVYVEHFCILPELRGKNYGAMALELLSRGGKGVILEIDPLVDDISVRRKNFYERAGYRTNGFEHVHPPYRRGFNGHRLVIMSSPAPLSEEEYKIFARYLSETVMRDVPRG